jgi:protein-disulfide isomerase
MQSFSRRLLLVAAAGLTLGLAACDRGGAAGGASAGDMTLGNANAPVKMVEYASVTCSHCATFNNEVFSQFKAKYIDTGRVHYTFKEFLTAPEQVAAAGFLIARCAGPDKYFSVVDAIFQNQQEMFTSGDPRGVLLRIAQSSGMTEQQFNACIQDEEALQALNSRVEKAIRQDGVSATPTFVINGEKVKEGAMTLAELEAAVAAAAK